MMGGSLCSEHCGRRRFSPSLSVLRAEPTGWRWGSLIGFQWIAGRDQDCCLWGDFGVGMQKVGFRERRSRESGKGWHFCLTTGLLSNGSSQPETESSEPVGQIHLLPLKLFMLDVLLLSKRTRFSLFSLNTIHLVRSTHPCHPHTFPGSWPRPPYLQCLPSLSVLFKSLPSSSSTALRTLS